MHRFYLPPAHCSGPTLTLSDGEAHHAARVLRLQPGERVTVLDGAGTELLCEVLRVDKREVALQVIEKKIHPAPPCELTLVQAIPKGKIIESIIEKATELGAHRIVPLLTERVTTKLDEDSAADKGTKWQHVAVEAIKQCGAAWLPRVDAPVTLREFIATKPQFDLAMVGALQGAARHPREVLQEFTTRESRRPQSIAVWIGPEGDLTGEELDQIQAIGAHPITLGPLVLRVETAAIYCLSFLNYEMQAGAW
jgi:16S rRNA (uracil1498-N3)-methyltransferase